MKDIFVIPEKEFAGKKKQVAKKTSVATTLLEGDSKQTSWYEKVPSVPATLFGAMLATLILLIIFLGYKYFTCKASDALDVISNGFGKAVTVVQNSASKVVSGASKVVSGASKVVSGASNGGSGVSNGGSSFTRSPTM
jgi:X-X-X-Leu-X-X-Gly heptad repeat protein